jgi:hypothetical protein
MNKPIYNERAYTMAKTAADASSITSVASETGYTRTSMSLYLSRSYPASPAKLEAAILARYDRYPCPHTGEEINGPDCHRRATAPRPFGGRAKEANWQACQACPHNNNQGDKP